MNPKSGALARSGGPFGILSSFVIPSLDICHRRPAIQFAVWLDWGSIGTLLSPERGLTFSESDRKKSYE
jgi:hypothetical protein